MNTDYKTGLSSEIKELPIMRFIGDQLPEQMKTPEAKKTASKIFFWGGLAALAMWLVSSLPTLIQTFDNLIVFGGKLILFGLIAIIGIVFFALSPKIISALHRIGSVQIFKGQKKAVEANPIENLQLLTNEIDSALKDVDAKINEADGVRLDFIREASDLTNGSAKKARNVVSIYDDAKKLRAEAKILEDKGLNDKAREKNREADEMEATAYSLKFEVDADKETAAMFAQYANEFGKAIEILKDNRSAARQYLNATKTTIRIIEQKLRATSRMKNASDGIAAAFNIKDSWVFQVAMQSAQAAISANIATIRNNLSALNQNKTMIAGTKSANRAELDDFVQQMKEGKIKKLNVAEVSDPGHDLTPEETVDPGLRIL